MEPSVIDTLRYADRLKAAGVETRQAEAMSRALSDELAAGVATKQDLDHAVDELRGEIGKVGNKVDALDARFDAQIDALDGKLDAKIDALDGKLDAKVDALDAKFDAKVDALDAKLGALSERFETQGRYVFLVLGLIAALGLYNAVAPHLTATAPQTSTESARA